METTVLEFVLLSILIVLPTLGRTIVVSVSRTIS